MTTAFRLRNGDTAPTQQSQTTCGSACLTVARMLNDALFAKWILTGDGPSPAGLMLPTLAARFAAYEQIVHRRTNSFSMTGGRPNLPWPLALGTPPWGAKKELEFGAARRGTIYDIEALRGERPKTLGARFDRLLELVADGEPGLLYVGDRYLPRHVLLILPDEGDGNLEIYDPASGRVSELTRAAFTGRRVALAGWDVPWFTIAPTGERPARSFSFRPVQAGAAIPG